MKNRLAQTKAHTRYIMAGNIPEYIRKKVGVRVTVRQVCRWIKQGSIQRYYPLAYSLKTRKIFTTTKQVDKFLKRAAKATTLKNSLKGYRKVLFDCARKLEKK